MSRFQPIHCLNHGASITNPDFPPLILPSIILFSELNLSSYKRSKGTALHKNQNAIIRLQST